MNKAIKRTFDFCLALLLLLVVSPLLISLTISIWLTDGRPVFYVSERMRHPDRSFSLWKLRTMRANSHDSGVSGGDKSDRITPIGRILRRYRLDELPQLWNILRGDMSFVGPRPPLRQYTDAFPELYDRVLKCRPGVTGLATLVFHAHEERLLSQCKTASETDAVYKRRCIPRKAHLDIIYQRNQSFSLDLWIIGQTFLRLISSRS